MVLVGYDYHDLQRPTAAGSGSLSCVQPLGWRIALDDDAGLRPGSLEKFTIWSGSVVQTALIYQRGE